MLTAEQIAEAREVSRKVCEAGPLLTLKNSAGGLSDLSFHVFPVRREAKNREKRERVGWRDKADVIITASSLTLELLGKNPDSIKEYSHLYIDDERYELTRAEYQNNIGDKYHHILIRGKI